MRLMDRLKSHKFPRVEHGLDVVIGKAMFMRLASIFRGEAARGHAPDQYIQPSELSPDELATMERMVGPHLERLGYGSR